MSSYKGIYECDYCGEKFLDEKKYSRHDKRECEPKKKYNLSRKAEGISAFHSYKKWRTRRGHADPDIQTFLDSKYFYSFIKFGRFCRKMMVCDVNHYMDFVIKLKLQPFQWYSDMIYNEYLTYIDRLLPIKRQIEITIEFMYGVANTFDCELSEAMNNIDPKTMGKLIRTRNLSPWVLLLSTKFKEYLIHSCSPEQRDHLSVSMNPEKWAKRIRGNPHLKQKTVEYLHEIGL